MKTLTASIDTLLGPVRLAATADGLSGLWFRGQQHEPPADPAAATMPVEHDPVLRRAADWITAYFAGEPEMPRPALAPRGTSFQRAVWDALLAIPRGSTVSYAELARSLGAPQSIRAAAAAVGRNPLSVLIPCHRVLGSDGSLTGYAGGLGRKRALLALEQGRGLPWRTIGSAYAPQYPDPIAVDVGDRVRFQARADDGEFPGWRWAEAGDGRCGWVPEAMFRVENDQGIARRRYSAREMPVAVGDRTTVLVLDEFGGWLWVSNGAGDPGWIPASVVAG
jgi:methylated-DNA-[protein]-cysteine S-methyltransferase